MSTTSILSDAGGSTSISSSIVSFKDAPRRTPLIFASQKGGSSSLTMRQQQHHQYYNQHRANMNNNSSILCSTEQQQDNASISSAGTFSQPEVSNSTRLTIKTVVTNAMGDGGRKAIVAVRRSIYRKHKSQPPPQTNDGPMSDASSNTSSNKSPTQQKEPLISFAKSRFEETGTQITQKRTQNDNNNHRNTWSATSLISSVSELPGKKKQVTNIDEATSNTKSTTTNMVAPPKKTAKETKKEVSNAAPPVTSNASTTTKLNASAQLLTKPRKTSTQKEAPSAVAAVIPKATTDVPTNNKLITVNNRRNVVSILATPTKGTKASILPLPAPSPTPLSPQKKKEESLLVIPPQSNRRSARALSGNEAALSASLKKESNIDEHIQIHQGAIDHTALTSQSPVAVMKDIVRILRILGIDSKVEAGTSPFILKCSRRKAKTFIAAELLKKKDDEDNNNDDNCADEDKYNNNDEFVINDSAITTTSEVSLLSPSNNSSASSTAGAASDVRGLEPIYGDASIDNGDKIRFAVEICRFKNLPGLYIVDIRRLRGNAWAYKFLYHKLIDFLDLGRNGGYIHN